MVPSGFERRPKGARIAFLLIHGFGAHIDEMETLGEYLQECNIASFSVSVAGHGTSPEDLAETNRDEWYDSARAGLQYVLSWDKEATFVSGLSMGGLLTLALAAREHGIEGIIPISPAIIFGGFLARLVPIIKHFMPYRKVDLTKMPEMYDVMRFKYDRDPLVSIEELLLLAKEVREELNKVDCPALILQSGEDKTIDSRGAELVFNRISSDNKILRLIAGAEHVLTCHPTRHQAYPMILDFVREVVGKTSPS